MIKSKYTILGLITIALLFSISGLQAQKWKMSNGKFSELKGQTSLNVEFDYSDMKVGKIKNEQDYIDKRKDEKNEKEAGTGDTWAEAWIADRENRFEPKFLELFNKHVEDRGLKADKGDESAKYTLIVHTVFTEPGFNIGIVRRNASTNIEFSLKDNESGKIVSEGTMTKIPGQGGGGLGIDFDTGWRISESYAKAGKTLGKYLSKKVLK